MSSFLAKFWRLTSTKTSYQNCLGFIVLCSNRWLKIEVTARQKSVFPRCLLVPTLFSQGESVRLHRCWTSRPVEPTSNTFFRRPTVVTSNTYFRWPTEVTSNKYFRGVSHLCVVGLVILSDDLHMLVKRHALGGAGRPGASLFFSLLIRVAVGAAGTAARTAAGTAATAAVLSLAGQRQSERQRDQLISGFGEGRTRGKRRGQE